MSRATALAAAAVVGLGAGCDRAADTETRPARASDPVYTADTTYVVDSLGNRLQIVVGRSSETIREVRPRAGSGDPDAPDAYRLVDPRTAHNLLRTGRPPWYVVDVRTAREYAVDGHIEGAALVPLDRLAENLGDLHVRTDQFVLVYGRTTADAVEGARILAAHGFPFLRVLQGGFGAWRAAGLPEATPGNDS